MKKLSLYLAVFLLLCCLTACGSADRLADTQVDGLSVLSTVIPSKAEVPEKERTFPVPVYGNTRIRLSWGEGKEIVVRLIDNDATADLVSKLPVSLPFEDYRGFQRDAILDLDPGTSPSQCDVFTGDFAYYDPWSHLTFFCEDFGYSRDLTPLGTIESGLEYLESINDGSEVLIELVEEKNLIVYFSRWGNTDYPDNVDANSPASIVLNGDDQYGITEYIARLIQQNAGGDLHLIQTVKPYPTDFDAVVDQNVKEMADGTLPQLVESDLDISEYDTIFIGYPIWAMTAPQPIFSFLKEYDLSGKTVVPFCTHHGYGAGRSYQNIADAIPGAETLDGFAIDGDKLENAEAETVQWLQTIGLMRGKVNEVAYTTPDGETGYLYLTDEILAHPEKKVPLVLAMCGTGRDTRKDAADMGWVDLARNGDFIVLAPNYRNGSTYSETDTIASVVKYITENYPVDATRVYSTGFSNGGALSVALCRDYPQLFAGIAAFGWMVDMPDRNGVYAAYDMPFQLIQGTAEYTYKTNSGAMAVMRDEQQALRALFRMNEMITQSTRTDYTKVPYWGYEPDNTHTLTREDRGWQFSDYYKDGYAQPFAQLVLIEGAEHTPHQYDARAAWQFLKQYSRNEKGEIVAVEPQTK
jgi:flavodoxin/poly(3-hydroxybutyrate) depolymerase